MALLRGKRWLTLLVIVGLMATRALGAADAPTENQVQAVFLYNFSRFVEWPPQAFAAPGDPFVIGIVGSDPFGARLDEAVHNEQINGHALTVRRYRNLSDVDNCQILFIDRSEIGRLGQILTALDHHSTLTVSQADGAAQRGVMIQFATENSRIRLRINVDAARAAGLTISSKLLRPAEIIGTDAKEER
ncbi:MAG TPA: YfiR family protein [Steroidobacteraceae bacterium]|nr:YfiR family protein [Steroidobacteraceae bacterium]